MLPARVQTFKPPAKNVEWDGAGNCAYSPEDIFFGSDTFG